MAAPAPFPIGAPVLAAVLASLAGCASTRLDAQWADPQLAAGTLHGARVLVVCEAYEAVISRVCQDQLAAELVARGATPVIAPELAATPGARVPETQSLATARQLGARAVLAGSAAPAMSQFSPGWTIGIGGFGVSSSGVGAGIGVSAPLGGGRVSTGYALSGRIVDSASGRLLWSGRASAPPSSDVRGQMTELARTLLDGADKTGAF